MDMFKVLIVEDDFRVADINKSVTESVEGFSVVGIAKTATEALEFIKSGTPDLAIVDIYLPDFSGMELIKKVRHNGYPVDMILITAAHDAATLENSMRYGVFDYIIKPFAFSRFREALSNYKIYHKRISGSGEYDQDEINGIMSHNMREAGRNKLPKGITAFTMDKIVSAINENPVSFTIDDVVKRIKLSKITVRRYLEFMAEAGSLKKTFEYKKKGRPVVIYERKK